MNFTAQPQNFKHTHAQERTESACAAATSTKKQPPDIAISEHVASVTVTHPAQPFRHRLGNPADKSGSLLRFSKKQRLRKKARQAYRAREFEDQALIRRYLPDTQEYERCRECGRSLGSVAAVLRDAISGKTSMGGVRTCGKQSLCKVCARSIRTRRAEQVTRGVQVVSERGGSSILLTLTAPHYLTEAYALKPFHEAFEVNWQRLLDRRKLARALDELGLYKSGRIKTYDILFNPDNGWHVHIHCELLFKKQLTQAQAEALHSIITDAWQHIWRTTTKRYQRVLSIPSRERGVNLKLGFDPAYISKVGYELAAPDTKSDSHGIDPLDLVKSALSHPDGSIMRKRLLAAWYEWCDFAKSKNRLLCCWGKGLAAELGVLDAEQSDEEIVEEDSEEPQGEVCLLTARLCNGLNYIGMTGRLLNAAEDAGAQGVADFLDALGFIYEVKYPRGDGVPLFAPMP